MSRRGSASGGGARHPDPSLAPTVDGGILASARVLAKQCLDRRIEDRDTLRRELAHWQRRRNAEGARVEWLLDIHRARKKLARVYPAPVSTGLEQAA